MSRIGRLTRGRSAAKGEAPGPRLATPRRQEEQNNRVGDRDDKLEEEQETRDEGRPENRRGRKSSEDHTWQPPSGSLRHLSNDDTNNNN